MASKLSISYAGTLSSIEDYNSSHSRNCSTRGFRRYLKVCKNNNIDWSTRTGYYFLHGLKSFKNNYPNLIDKLEVRFWGSISKGNTELAQELKLEGVVKFDGFMDHSSTVELLDKSDYVLLPLETRITDKNLASENIAEILSEPLHIPGKLYEYLEARRKILILAEQSDCKEIAEKAGLAIGCDPRDPNKIADTLAKLITDPPSLGEPDENEIKKYSYEQIGARLTQIIDELLDP